MIKLPLLLAGAAVVFSCNSGEKKQNDPILYSFAGYKEKTISLSLPDWEGDYIYYRAAETGELLIWNYPNYQLKLLSQSNYKTKYTIDLDSLFRFNGIDVCLQNDSLIISGYDSKLGIWDLTGNIGTSSELSFSNRSEQAISYSSRIFPIFFEDNNVFLFTSNSYNDYMTDFEQQKKFFLSPIEVQYNIESGNSVSFGSYPAMYTKDTMDFYDWRPHRQRFNGNSIYSFPIIDSLYIYNSITGNQHAVECKSALDTKPFIPFNKNRYFDYTYIYDHLLSNGRNYGLIADPYRNLLYSIFLTGNDPPKDRRLKYSDVAFTVLIFDANMVFIKEVYFPPGWYNPGQRFITADGLAFQTASSDVAATRTFDIFDFTKDGFIIKDLPDTFVNTKHLVPLNEYLWDSLSVPSYIDSIIIISGMGCTGCLENLVIEAEASGKNIDKYGFVITQEASRTLTIQDFVKRRKHVWVEKTGELSYYRNIGDFLTLVVLKDEGILIDDKFSF